MLALLSLLVVLGVGVVQAAGTATIVLNPVSNTVPMNTSFEVMVELNAGTEQVSSADLVLAFDPTKLEVVKVSELVDGIKLFPVNTVSIDNATGRVTVNSSMSEVTEYFTGRDNWLVLSLASKATPGQAQLNFACVDGDETDTNVMQKGTEIDIVNCDGLVSGVYTVSASAPTFTPTPMPTPTTAVGLGGVGDEPEVTATPTAAVPESGVVENTVGILVIGLGLLLLAGVGWQMNKI